MFDTRLRQLLLSLSEKHHLPDEVKKRVSAIAPEDITIKVAILGEFKCGKSTLTNALLGKRILPAFGEPTSAVLTEIAKSESDRYFVRRIKEDGSEVVTDISPGDLADEIMNHEPGKVVHIHLKDIDLLDSHVSLIDTPGVNSINDTHDDVTFGYLPFVDVAIVVMDVNTGAPSKSLLEFLDRIPKEEWKKFYFVLNKTDLISPTASKSIKERYRVDLSAHGFENPNLLTLSAKQELDAIDGNSKHGTPTNGVDWLRKTIAKDILAVKEQIAAERANEALRNEARGIVSLLQEILATLQWNAQEFDSQIKSLKQEVSELEVGLRRFESDFDQVKSDCLAHLQKVLDDYSYSISAKLAKEEPVDDLITGMVNEVNSLLSISVGKLRGIKIPGLGETVGQLIAGSIVAQTARMREIANLLVDVSTFAATVWLIPGGTGTKEAERLVEGVAVAGGRSVGKLASRGEKLLKALGALGKFIDAINPLEQIKKAILPSILNNKVRSVMFRMITDRIVVAFEELKTSMRMDIDTTFLQPKRDKENLIVALKDQSSKKLVEATEHRAALQRDIDALNSTIGVGPSRNVQALSLGKS